MTDSQRSGRTIRNRFLAALPDDEFDFIQPHFVTTTFAIGTLLARAGDSMTKCYFPNNGMISLLCLTERGGSVEAGYVGYEGMLGTPVLIGKNEMPYEALVQAPTDCFVVDAAVARDLFAQGGTFHDIALRYFYVIVKQMAQTCVCNHFHTIETRFCRWLTVMCERSGDKHLSLTHEFIAHMLGVQRTSVSTIATSLQQKGIIRYSRGRIEILDFERLKGSACECYRIVKEEFEEFLNEKKFRPMSTHRQTSAF